MLWMDTTIPYKIATPQQSYYIRDGKAEIDWAKNQLRDNTQIKTTIKIYARLEIMPTTKKLTIQSLPMIHVLIFPK